LAFILKQQEIIATRRQINDDTSHYLQRSNTTYLRKTKYLLSRPPISKQAASMYARLDDTYTFINLCWTTKKLDPAFIQNAFLLSFSDREV